MIEIDGVKYLTEAQWNKKHRAVLKRQREKGIQKEWYTSPTRSKSAVFYREDQTRPYNQRELSAAKRKQRELIKTRRERLSCCCCGEYFGRNARFELEYGLCTFCRKDHTSWQWLSEKHMAVKEGEDAYGQYPERWDPDMEDWISSERKWFYYSWRQVKHVSEKRFEALKQKYITLYGGWETIDLAHTLYNGKKWW